MDLEETTDCTRLSSAVCNRWVHLLSDPHPTVGRVGGEEFRPAVDGTEDGRGRRLAQTTERRLGHGVADVAQGDHVVGPRPAIAQDALDDLQLALRADLARVALAATLVGEEAGQHVDDVAQVDVYKRQGSYSVGSTKASAAW